MVSRTVRATVDKSLNKLNDASLVLPAGRDDEDDEDDEDEDDEDDEDDEASE